jgi:hypothetical protein
MSVRLAIAGVLLVILVAPGRGQPPPVATLGRAGVEPDGAGGRAPVDPAGGTVETIDVIREIAKQGTLGLLLLAVLWSYRRDFFRRDEDARRRLEEERERSNRLGEVIDRSTTAITSSTVATARQTDATHRLARTVENLERRQAGLPPSAGSPRL